MRYFVRLFSILVAASLFVVLPLQAQKGGGQAKVDIIHNGHLITVAEPAVAAHLAHGDKFPVTTKTVTLTVSGVATYSGSATVDGGGTATFTVYLDYESERSSYGVVGDGTLSYSIDLTTPPGVLYVTVSNVQSDVDVTITLF